MPGKKVARVKKTPSEPSGTDPLKRLLEDVENAYRTGRFLIIVADLDFSRPKDKRLNTRHHTDRFPAGDFDSAIAIQKKRFFENLKVQGS